ncbi:penicillin-binding protein [Carnobacterium iners]|uniref:Penicillin-binding protein n=1 Tax=Carnobacterium iners TaxID=1073423 RepID=A0A1X7N936_9LACT|nr:penicillin-binding transpeptidase domain-containing protein [Carnobacterium iners]SEK47105.1 penicillin-binding protein [Carnobacterium iners]SMH33245.1 penicillin-binding protein [Carnobacterium iners]
METIKRNKKKKQPSWKIIVAMSLILITIIGVGAGYYFWSKQKDEKAAQQTVDSYVNALEKQDYSKLSQLASQKSLKKIVYTKKEIKERYEAIYGGIGVSDVTVSGVKSVLNKEKDHYDVTYNMQMTTSLGKLETQSYATTMSKEQEDYRVDWSTKLIFPDLELKDKISLATTIGERGDILSKDGSPLATEGKFWDAGLYPEALGEGIEKDKKLAVISEKYTISAEQLENKLAAEWVLPESFVPFKIVKDGETPEVPGVLYQEKTLRTYPLNEAAAHLIGYVGETTAEDIEKNPSLQAGDIIGKAGLEAAFNERLNGQKGGRIVINDETDQLKKVIQEMELKNGEDIILTINAKLQKAAYEKLKGENGSAVFMDPKDGSLLSLVSTPSYDANQMTMGISTKDYQKYTDDVNNPFLSRFASGYAPGSTFKTITAAIGLDSGVTTVDETHKIDGLKWQKESSWGNHYIVRVSDTPQVNLESALVYSDNIYFAKEALEMGQKAYEEGLSKFIFGEKLDLPIAMNPAQLSNEGTLANEKLLADTAYGQGQLLLNPIQQAVSFSVFANQGQLIFPKLTADQKTAEPKMAVTVESADIVKNNLIKVVENPEGTAHSLASLNKKNLAAKTGTAETTASEVEGEDADTNGFLLTFDAENKSYLMVAIIEGKSSGDVTTTMKPLLGNIEDLLN